MGQLLGVGGSKDIKAAGGFTIGSKLLPFKTEPSAPDIEGLFLFAAAWSLGATANTGELHVLAISVVRRFIRLPALIWLC